MEAMNKKNRFSRKYADGDETDNLRKQNHLLHSRLKESDDEECYYSPRRNDSLRRQGHQLDVDDQSPESRPRTNSQSRSLANHQQHSSAGDRDESRYDERGELNSGQYHSMNGSKLSPDYSLASYDPGQLSARRAGGSVLEPLEPLNSG